MSTSPFQPSEVRGRLEPTGTPVPRPDVFYDQSDDAFYPHAHLIQQPEARYDNDQSRPATLNLCDINQSQKRQDCAADQDRQFGTWNFDMLNDVLPDDD